MCPNGHVAEWLRSGLQNRLPRFNSGRGLQRNQSLSEGTYRLTDSRQRFVSRSELVALVAAMNEDATGKRFGHVYLVGGPATPVQRAGVLIRQG